MRILEKLLLVREIFTTVCLLDYSYFNNHYKMIAVDLSKQQDFDVDPKTIQKR